jgi:hypothetical protein
MVSKPCQDRFLHPILVHSIIEKKENTGSQMGHTKKIFKKRKCLKEQKKISWCGIFSNENYLEQNGIFSFGFA